MKQLTKEQHEAILNWLNENDHLTYPALEFSNAFPPACCDSCADGHTCESEQIKPVEYPEQKLSIENDLGVSTEKDRLMYGVSYLEITNKSIRRIDPTKIRIMQPKSIPDQRSEFDDNLAIQKKYYEEHPDRMPLVSVDRIPEETSAEYMDRVAKVNGRK